MHSIQNRLALGLSLSLILLLLVQWIVVGISIRYLSENYIATHLIQDSETLLVSISFSNNNEIVFNKTNLGPIFSQPFSGLYYKISIGKKEFRSRSLWDTDLPHTDIINGSNNNQTVVIGPQQQTLLQITKQYKKKSKLIIISVAEELTPIYKDITTFQIRYSIVTLLIALILIAIQAIIVNKNLKPLDVIRTELKSLDEGIISQLQENVPSEVLPLVRELNRQLKSFRQRLDRTRNATGNLAHTLKTPLSLLYQLADDASIKENKELRDSLLHSVKTIEQSINRELKRARIAGAQLSAPHSKLEPEIESLINTMKTIYQQKNLNIHYDISTDMLCSMDRQDLMEMLGNVLDNACKWAKHEVLLTIKNNQEIIFIIEDDGPGCTNNEMKKLTTRGVRLDEQITGHGLGLSIVQEIVDDYNGILSISTSKKFDGLRIQICIPTKN